MYVKRTAVLARGRSCAEVATTFDLSGYGALLLLYPEFDGSHYVKVVGPRVREAHHEWYSWLKTFVCEDLPCCCLAVCVHWMQLIV